MRAHTRAHFYFCPPVGVSVLLLPSLFRDKSNDGGAQRSLLLQPQLPGCRSRWDKCREYMIIIIIIMIISSLIKFNLYNTLSSFYFTLSSHKGGKVILIQLPWHHMDIFHLILSHFPQILPNTLVIFGNLDILIKIKLWFITLFGFPAWDWYNSLTMG